MRHFKLLALIGLIIGLGYGALVWAAPGTPGYTNAFTIVTTSTQVLAAKTGNVRHGFLIQNIGALPVFAKICAPNAASCTATATTGLYIPAPAATTSPVAGQLMFSNGGAPEFQNSVPQGEVDLIATGTTTAIVIEW
jgi:hypothetical protein